MHVTKLVLRSKTPALAAAWRAAFAPQIGRGVVDVAVGDIFDADADALLSPANSFGYMDGGIDALYRDRFGMALEVRVQSEIRAHHFGELHIGEAIVVPTGDTPIAFLVVAPTMRVPMDVAHTTNAYVALRAALAAIHAHNIATPRDRIASLLSPGLCTGIGAMPPAIAAKQMRLAWDTVVEGHRFSRADEALASQARLLSAD